MKEYTQSTLAPNGNCWQTAVACLLEVDPASLPDQSKNDYIRGADGKWTGTSYNNFLQSYLMKHHDLAYVELHLPPEGLSFLALREPGWHLMTGRTVRSDVQGGVRHVVVGRYGEVVWDPHPSRAGLTDDVRWALLIPRPAAWDGKMLPSCICPSCVGT